MGEVIFCCPGFGKTNPELSALVGKKNREIKISKAVALVTDAAKSLGWEVTTREENVGGEDGVMFEFECDDHKELDVWCTAWMRGGWDVQSFLGELYDYYESFDPDYQTRLAVTETGDERPIREILADKENEAQVLWDFWWCMEKKLGEVAL